MKSFKALAVLVVTSTSTYADGVDNYIHPIAHVAASYAITHGTSVVCRRVSNASRLTCSIVGAIVSAAAGAAIELNQPGESMSKHGLSAAQDAVGIGLAMTMINLDF